MTGRMAAYNPNVTIKQFIYTYANSSPEREKAKLRAQSVRGSEDSGDNKFENPALKVKYFYQPKLDNGNALIGGLVTVLTQLLKKAPAVPLNEGQTGKIKAVVVIISALAVVVMAYVTGDLTNIEVVLHDAILNTLAAFVLYSAVY